MVWYHYDINAILNEPMKNRIEEEINRAFKAIHDKLTKQEYKPKVYRINNRCFVSLKEYIQDKHIEYQLVTPHIHRRNVAERAIKTFKDFFGMPSNN